MKLTQILLSLALLAPGAMPADDTADHAADAEHAATDREGDASVFGELFAHLVPYPLTALWFSVDPPFIHVVKPYPADAEGNPLRGTAAHPVNYHSSSDLTAARLDELGGGFGLLIYNINTVMWIAGLLLFLVFVPMKRKAVALAGQAPRGVFYGMFEPLVLFVRDEMVYAIMGKQHGRRFVPLFLTMFFFILFMNLLGLVYMGPVGGSATASWAVTLGLATVTFLWIHISGLMTYGPITHLKNFMPPGLPGVVVPGVVAVVEAVGIVVKPFALTVRLAANMTAGHLIVLALFGLIYFFASYFLALPILGMAVGIYALETFVAFVQAYVFTYLSIVFIGASVHPEH
jgi:F-type H+-transporting ATPase subunit a